MDIKIQIIDMLKSFYRPYHLYYLLLNLDGVMECHKCITNNYSLNSGKEINIKCNICKQLNKTRKKIIPNTEIIKIILKYNYRCNYILTTSYANNFSKHRGRPNYITTYQDISEMCFYILREHLGYHIQNIIIDTEYNKYIKDFIEQVATQGGPMVGVNNMDTILLKYNKILNIDDEIFTYYASDFLEQYWESDGGGYFDKSYLSHFRYTIRLFNIFKMPNHFKNKLLSNIEYAFNNSDVVTDTNFNYIYNIGILYKYHPHSI